MEGILAHNNEPTFLILLSTFFALTFRDIFSWQQNITTVVTSSVSAAATTASAIQHKQTRNLNPPSVLSFLSPPVHHI